MLFTLNVSLRYYNHVKYIPFFLQSASRELVGDFKTCIICIHVRGVPSPFWCIAAQLDVLLRLVDEWNSVKAAVGSV